MSNVTRRNLLKLLGAGAFAIGCGSSDDSVAATPDPDAGAGPLPDGGIPEVDAATADGSSPVPTGLEMLQGVENIVVVMMENRSFDHFFGALKRDAAYASRATVAGSTGAETNPAPTGPAVKAFKATTYTHADPPHSFVASHAQFNGGKNDQFVVAHEGPNQKDVMAYYDRSQIPFYYWLADNYTICDHWYASVMGPTWPNRFYLHAGTSTEKKNNTPILAKAPVTVWEHMKTAGKTATNYYAGKSGFFASAFPTKIAAGVNPMKKIDAFFAAAKAGTLPSLSYIDPDYGVSDDHPARDIRLGQAFVASVYKALAASPQWSKTLLIITYDEHGGFFDHVPPTKAPDDDPDFQQFGFRVPTIIVGPTVKRGFVSSTAYDHTSVLATLGARFGLKPFTSRSTKANPITDVFDPALFKNPAPPATNPPVITVNQTMMATIGESSQPEMEEAMAAGRVPLHLIDARPDDLRIGSWLRAAEGLGAIKLEP